MTDHLPPGLYRRPITREIDSDVLALGQLAETGALDVDSPTVLARHVSAVLRRSLQSARDITEQVTIVNRILETLDSLDAIARPEELLAILTPTGGLAQPARIPRPTTAIDQDALLVNGPLDPNLAGELRHEIASADRIDLLCAFIVWSGLNAVRDAMTGRHRAQLVRDIPQDFPYLPAGCTIRLDSVAKDIVLNNVRNAVRGRVVDVAADLREIGDVTLQDFLRESERGLDEVYAVGGWTRVRRYAGIERRAPEAEEDQLQRSVGRMPHIDDTERVERYTRWLDLPTTPDVTQLTLREQRLLEMLQFDLWGQRSKHQDLTSSLDALWRNETIREELVQLLTLLGNQATTLGFAGRIPDDVPLLIHERYSRDEILAAVGEIGAGRNADWREGVRYVKSLRTDIFAFTLEKSERRFSPSTMYRDYALSPDLFHWESQSTTGAESPTGRRYADREDAGHSVWLFVRESNERLGVTLPLLFAGPATYVSHTGSRPMAITWRLEHPLPADLYLVARAAV